jgi:transposase-like protein
MKALAHTSRGKHKPAVTKNTDHGVRYEPAQRREAFRIYVEVGGRLSAVQRKTGVDYSTLRRWKREESWKSKLLGARDEAWSLVAGTMSRKLARATIEELSRTEVIEQEVFRLLGLRNGETPIVKPKSMEGMIGALTKLSERRLELLNRAFALGKAKGEPAPSPSGGRSVNIGKMNINALITRTEREVRDLLKQAHLKPQDVPAIEADVIIEDDPDDITQAGASA